MINENNCAIYLHVLKALTGLHNEQLGKVLGYSRPQVQRVLSLDKQASPRMVQATKTAITALLGPFALVDISRLITEVRNEQFK